MPRRRFRVSWVETRQRAVPVVGNQARKHLELVFCPAVGPKKPHEFPSPIVNEMSFGGNLLECAG